MPFARPLRGKRRLTKDFAMIGSRKSATHAAAHIVLAAGSLLAGHRMLAADSNQLAWAPTREDAIVVDGMPANMLPQDSALSRSLMAKRPRNLARPAPGRTYLTDAPIVGETL